MIRHIAVFRFLDGTTADEIAALTAALLELPAQVPSIRAYTAGPDAALGAGRWHYAVVADFDDEAGWREYDQHPAHDAVRRDLVAPLLADRAAVQISV